MHKENRMISEKILKEIFQKHNNKVDQISRIRTLQTHLNSEWLDIPKKRREVNNNNMRWLIRNVKINNPKRAPKIINLIKELV
tara:strand:+ start:170 stop:418 length:249 start_codon:yes stop_codon:yes gene_type:complete